MGTRKPRKIATTRAAVNSGKNSGRDALGKFTKGNPFVWRSGQSGNPKGRPTRGDELAEYIKFVLFEPNDQKRDWSRLYTMIRLMLSSKSAADHVEILNRAYGKLPQAITFGNMTDADLRNFITRELGIGGNSDRGGEAAGAAAKSVGG